MTTDPAPYPPETPANTQWNPGVENAILYAVEANDDGTKTLIVFENGAAAGVNLSPEQVNQLVTILQRQ